jgi:NTP pyrophosphatase (non-canonical NTP hydrolase)
MNSKQEEILNITQEECGELIQVISKVRRFGIDEIHLKDRIPNRQRLAEEIGDVACMIQLLVEFGIVDVEAVESAMQKKVEKLKVWSNIYVDGN